MASPLITGGVYGVILNTRAELAARAASFTAPPYQKPPRAPVLYIKPPNTYAAHDAEVVIPAWTETVEVSPTLAVVIGETACRVAADRALDHVAGFTLALDVSLPHGEVFRPAITQRCRDGFLPIGPRVSPRGEAPDPDALDLRLSVNGQAAGGLDTRELVRSTAALIAEITDFMTLFAGDVLLVGLPYPAPLARAGDEVAVQAEGLGRLACRLVTAP